jgi:hypothetical protein
LVRKKLMSSCWTMRSMRERAVISMSLGCNKVRAEPLRRSEA